MSKQRCSSGDISTKNRLSYNPPVPQVLEHALHEPQDDTAQSLLLYCEHFVASFKAGQALPLQYGLAVTRRVLVFVPANH